MSFTMKFEVWFALQSITREIHPPPPPVSALCPIVGPWNDFIIKCFRKSINHSSGRNQTSIITLCNANSWHFNSHFGFFCVHVSLTRAEFLRFYIFFRLFSLVFIYQTLNTVFHPTSALSLPPGRWKEKSFLAKTPRRISFLFISRVESQPMKTPHNP